MITNEQIAQAEAEANAAEAARMRAERNYASAPAAHDTQRRFDEAARSAAHAAARVRQLHVEYAAQETARAARAAALEAAAKDFPAIAKQLDTSANTVIKALKDAEAAMVKLLTAAGAHDALVRAASASLRARGLVLENGVDEETGAGWAGELRLSGEWWRPVDAPSLLARSFTGVVAENAPRHALGRWQWTGSGGRSVETDRDAMGRRLPRHGQ